MEPINLYRDRLLKHYIIHHNMITISIVLFFYTWLYGYHFNSLFFFYYNLTAGIFNLIVYFYICRMPMCKIRPFINLYFIFFVLYMLVYAFCMWEKSPIIFAWLFLIPLASGSLFSQKTTVSWIFCIVALAIITMICSKFLYVFFEETTFSSSDILLINICSLLFIFYFLIAGTYFNRRVYKLSSFQESKETTVKQYQSILNTSRGIVENYRLKEQLKKLYETILIYFEKEQPFKNKDFSLIQLADALNTNVSYVSRAIKLNTGSNFNHLVNTYRVAHVKMLINEDALKRHSLLYVYDSAGFKHQSTFNKVFKQIEGVTPKTYAHNMTKHE
ncbi:AraC family transcriptional regulator [Pedobacter chitinilyticus]|uniref:AraC family transcriptional regulator n=2 Tax=Pedobacter chitinilyticus TaxID=2233776 RepID=A0A3S4RS34_9SPHI|nr:AraC family transcriptional regulator [Pedobacter chitinilyticus]